MRVEFELEAECCFDGGGIVDLTVNGDDIDTASMQPELLRAFVDAAKSKAAGPGRVASCGPLDLLPRLAACPSETPKRVSVSLPAGRCDIAQGPLLGGTVEVFA